MATINGSTSRTGWTFKLEVVENSTSIANNSSKMTVTAYIGRSSSDIGSFLQGADITCPVSITGAGSKNITYRNTGTVNIAAGGWLSLGSVVFDSVPHDANGSKTVTVSATFTSDIQPTSGSASGSVKLTTIPRASTFTIDKTTIYANGKDAITVTINAKNTAYKHTVLVAFGSSYSQTFNVAAGVTTQSFTIPYEWLNGIPAQESSNSTNIILSTYNGTTLVGTASLPKGFTIVCPSDVKPTISSVTVTGNNLRDGVYVQGKSSATIKTVAGGAYGSKIVSYSCVIDDVKYTGSEFTTAPFKWVGTYNLTVTVTDSRGQIASKSTSPIYVLEYKTPYITNFTAERQADGTTVVATLIGGCSPINDKNTKSFTVTLNGKTQTINSSNYMVNGTTTFTGVDADSTFVATARVADFYTETTMPVVVPTEAVTMDFHHSGNGMALGKVSESAELLDVAWAIKSPSVDNLLGGYGNLIPSDVDLNTAPYFNVGTYVCVDNNVAKGLKNCPSTSAFKMTVTNVVGQTVVPNPAGYWYFVREITNWYGEKWIQYIHCNGSTGATYSEWFVVLDNSKIRDYVVDHGKTGLWTYRKWNSGIAECWGTYTTSGVNAAQNSYSGFYYSTPIEITLPFEFVNIDDFQVNGGSNDRINFARQFGANSTKASFVICGHQSDATSVYISVYLSVKGKWK